MYAVCPGQFEQLADGAVKCSQEIQLVADQASALNLIDPVIMGQHILAGVFLYIVLTVVGSPVKGVIQMFKAETH